VGAISDNARWLELGKRGRKRGEIVKKKKRNLESTIFSASRLQEKRVPDEKKPFKIGGKITFLEVEG
jgi:hypothetical protein